MNASTNPQDEFLTEDGQVETRQDRQDRMDAEAVRKLDRFR